MILPTTLKHLVISHWSTVQKEVRWSLEGPIVLPPGLTSLIVQDGDVTSKKCLEIGLPPNLLFFENKDGFENAECLRLLPRTITFLETAFLGKMKTDKIFPVESSLWLPPALTTLSIAPIAITSLQWINGLPKTLTKLVTYLWPANDTPIDFPDHSSEHIDFPPSLTELKLFLGEGFNRIDRIVEHLPRKLQVLKISHFSSSGVTDRQVSAFPRLIHTLALSEKDYLTSECLNDLPPHLAMLMLVYSEPRWFLFRDKP